MNERRKSRLLILLSVIVALILCVGVFCACEKDEITYSVMLPSGEHYTVTSSNIVKASRGGEVAFDVNIEDGYALYSTSSGAYADNKLVVDNVKYDMTIIFDVRKKANITYDTPNAKVEITPIMNGELIVGEKARLSAVANENYNLESLTINGVALDIAAIDGIPSKVVEVVLEENNLVKTETLGDEYAFTIECDSSRGSYTVERDSKDENYRYGDNVTIKTQAIAPNYFGYYNYNGQLVTENKPLQLTINGATGVKIQFYNEFEHRIIYNPNGGIIAPNAFQDILYTAEEYVNIDHCYNKITRDRYSLVGLREGLDGEVHRLGAMARIPQANLELYAIWEEWTDSSYFLSEAIDDNTCRIVGYTPKIGTNSLAKLVIPEIIDGRKVVEIGANAFKDNQYLKEVVFNKNTVTVGDNAFANCPSLIRIMIFESMTSRSDSAFASCPNFTTCAINATSDPDHSDSYSSSIAERWNELRRAERGKKMIFLSGSSSGYGVDVGQIIEWNKKCYEPLVFGLNAGFGVRIYFDIVAPFLQEEDIVVLSPEYMSSMYCDEGWTGGNFAFIQKNYDMASYVDVKNSPAYFNSLNAFFASKISGGNYRPVDRNNFPVDKYGVMEGDRSKNNVWMTGYYGLDMAWINSSFQNTYVGFGEKARAKKAKVYFTFPPLFDNYQHDYFKDNEYRKNAIATIAQTLCKGNDVIIPVISDISNYIMEGKYFFDSIFHLTNIGASIRTTQLLKDIDTQLAKEGK